ncbi:DASH complex subunit Ask1-domain-containing protein [Phascolomyces articulosus]|uniref:DASH complex subunit ASK1 n=1 Tax=Phascolomyces articulosus TaxID=60185 RepID=A0AAD5KLY4_9FUNG|nr:DASH complex subunit Ask1-domain-containing protein [Phascolomyces articulosus]
MSRQTDEEENAELEKLQQEITLTLQAIDENFARCTQIVSQGIIPEVERYSAASKRVWDGLKVWVYFFQHVDNNIVHHQTNRPPFSQIPPEPTTDPTPWDRLKDKFSPSSQDLSRLLQRPGHAHLPGSHTTATSATLARPHARVPTFASSSSTGDSSSTSSFRHRTSPPKTLPFAISSKDLLNTPAREAAHIMVDNRLRRMGIESSPSSSDETSGPSRYKGKQPQHQQEQIDIHGDETPASWVANNDNEEDRAHFEGFMRERQKRYQNMDPDAELPIVRNRPIPKSPGQQEGQDLTSFLTANNSLFSSPAVNFDQDLRPSSKRTRVDMMDDDDVGSLLAPASTTNYREEPSNIQQHDNGEEDDDEDDDEDMDSAYEFSQIRPSDIVAPRTDDRESGASTPVGSVGGVSITSSSSQLPKQFSLHYFSSMYREPPASTQLTRIYTLFSDQPDQPLLVDQVLELVDDDKSFTPERVKLFINVLVSKKFLKKESAGRYILRQ